eukprot:INCI15387.2.p1 GENE.INCI15387.2~~INCI15387.2.p1  ORF type:complete len:273 (+),score=38.89 INCI15387.2:97-915(+)
MEHLVSFIAGASFGATSVLVGQPLDTVKTRMQAHQQSLKANPLAVATEVFRKEGVRGLYRGGMPIFVGGALFRSAQFGVYEAAMKFAKVGSTEDGLGAPRISDTKLFGFLQPQVVFSGFCGGIARGLVEGPFEYVKVCRQLEKPWTLREVYNGSGATIFRNSFLFSFFVVYLDLTKQVFGDKLGAFWTGALCANAAWLTVWPMDVIKTQVQSGNYRDRSVLQIAAGVVRSGQMFRGVVPGLMRSTIANGCSMVVYRKVEGLLKAQLHADAEA